MDPQLLGVPNARDPFATLDSTELCWASKREVISSPDLQDRDTSPWPRSTEEDTEAEWSEEAVGRPGILVVDDTEAVRSVLAMGLEHHGFAVWSANSGRHAFQLYREHRAEIAVVLLDVSMPGLNGPDTLFALQQLNPAVRCCFLSGDTGAYTEKDLLQLGALMVLQKPFQLGLLAQLLWDVLDWPATASA
jgi:CheY-like chemotaxis protein